MAFFEAAGSKHFPLGRPCDDDVVAHVLGLPVTSSAIGQRWHQIPIDEILSSNSQSPAVVHAPSSKPSQVFRKAAEQLLETLAQQSSTSAELPPNTLTLHADSGKLILDVSRPYFADEFVGTLEIDPLELRKRSQDAWSTKGDSSQPLACGQADTDVESESTEVGYGLKSVIPTKINRKGNYGFEVQWDDGLKGSIYGFVVRFPVESLICTNFMPRVCYM